MGVVSQELPNVSYLTKPFGFWFRPIWTLFTINLIWKIGGELGRVLHYICVCI